MITATARDAGTRAVVSRGYKPGMDRLYWRGLREFQEDTFEDRRLEAATAMREQAGTMDVAPWPLPVPKHMPLDRTPRYEGLTLRLHERNQHVPDSWGDVPAGEARIDTTPIVTRRDHTNLSRYRTPAEVRATIAPADDPRRWLRLAYGNEGGGVDFREAVHLQWRGVQSSEFTFSLDDNDFFVPFDLRHPERYLFVDDDGVELEGGQVFSRFRDHARLTVYLAPRRWRWFAWVLAHYLYVGLFERVENDEVFLATYHDRPPIYPYRHNVLETRSETWNWHEYYGAYLAYDQAIEFAWDNSFPAARVRHEIVAQQYWSPCLAYILLGVEPAAIALWRTPPRPGDCVLGLGRVDKVTGIERRIWIHQGVDASSTYPQTLIGQYIAAFDWSGPLFTFTT